ncbi:MAG TPA: hypothetical protein VHL34_08335 [Rhizomicrobium sp.]|jgi:hypothetical protein|nr:hypothetical protein [Rhizomicrobium sp.]
MKHIHTQSLKGLGLAGVLAGTVMAVSSPAQAGYEFATPAGFCSNKIDRPGDGSDLRLPIGTVDVEFWGFGLDTASSVSVSNVDGTGTTAARIMSRHGGAENNSKGCGAIGSIVIRLTNGPDTITSGYHKRLNIGTASDSRVALSIRRIPKQDRLTWGSVERLSCLGTRTVQDNNHTMIIQLPPGHRDDHSNCSGTALILDHGSSEDFQVDVRAPFNLHFNGLPAGTSADAASLESAYTPTGTVKINLNAATIRAITTPLIGTISVAGPNNLTSNTVRLEIRPQLGQGLSALTASPSSISVGDLVDIGAQIASVAGPGGQPLDFTATTAACWDLAQFADSPRLADPSFHTFSITAGQTIGSISLRSLSGQGCAAKGTGARHTVKVFIPGTDPVSCPLATCRTVSVNVVSRAD